MQHGLQNPENLDPEKNLSEEGKKEVEKMAIYLRENKVDLGQIWHSGKTRALQTATIVGGLQRPFISPQQKDAMQPLDDPQAIFQALSAEELDTMLVGHMPHLKKLAALLLINDPAADLIAFQPGSIVCLQNSADKWLISWMIVPAMLK